MKIVIDARFWGAKDTGLGRYTLNLVRELANLGSAHDYLLLVRRRYEEGLDRLPANFRLAEAPAHPYAAAGQAQVIRRLFRFNPDVVHIPHGGIPVVSKGRLVLTVHDLIKQRWSGRASTTRSPLVHLVKFKTYRLLLAAGVRRARAIIVPTRHVKRELETNFPGAGGKIEVVYEGVDRVFLQPAKTGAAAVLKKYGLEKPFVIYTGNLYPYKNVAALIAAVKAVGEELPRLRLAVASGRSVFGERLKVLAAAEGVENEVSWLGFVPDEDLAVLYRQALAFVSASLDEGFGITPLEALAAGGRAALADIPAFREVCGRSAWYFDPRRPEELVGILVKLESGKLKKRPPVDLDRFSWRKMAVEIQKIYEKVGSA
jgi:glycosyltransferase involved in cell wall biosynthesis